MTRHHLWRQRQRYHQDIQARISILWLVTATILIDAGVDTLSDYKK